MKVRHVDFHVCVVLPSLSENSAKLQASHRYIGLQQGGLVKKKWEDTLAIDKSRDGIIEAKQTCVDISILKSLAPAGCILELNESTHTVSLLSADVPHIIAQQEFTRNEWNIFITLLQSHPHHAPFELLLASITELSPTDCRSRIYRAQQAGGEVLKQELKPVYRVLSGVRKKLASLHPQLKILLIREVGYILVKVSE